MSKLISLMMVLIATLSFSGLAAAQEPAEEPVPDRPWLGISINDTEAGIEVVEVVPDSPAANAGFESGDIITSINGEEVGTANALVEWIQGRQQGDSVTVSVTRGEENVEIEVELGAFPEGLDLPGRPGRPGRGGRLRAIPFGDLNMMPMFGALLEKSDDGLVVTEVFNNSDAESQLQEGDVITSINGEPAADFDLRSLLEMGLNLNDPVPVTVQRGDEELALELEVFPGGMTTFEFGEGMPEGFSFSFSDRPRLGIEFRLLDEAFATNLGITQTSGALVVRVLDDSVASEAGLQAGDIITGVNGVTLDGEANLRELITNAEAGTITLSVLRAGETLELSVELPDRLVPQPPVPAEPVEPGATEDGSNA